MKKILLGLFVSVLLLTGVYQVDASPVEESITRTLMEGMKGSDVSYLQTYLGIPSDGYYGPQTVTKVRNWQRQNSIFADGMFGPGSLKKLISNQNTGSVLGATADTTPRIMYWLGKINQHVDSNGVWQTDPDENSGADIDKLTYCKKWFPNTISVEPYISETINTWMGGADSITYTNTKVSDKCVQGTVIPTIVTSATITATDCIVPTTPANSGSCATKITWNVVNPKAGSTYKIITVSPLDTLRQVQTIISGNSGSVFSGISILKQVFAVVDSSNTSQPLATVSPTATCATGTIWNTVSGCVNDQTVNSGVPILVTSIPQQESLPTSMKIGGHVMSNGGSTITSRGIVWGTYPNPTITKNSGYLTAQTNLDSYVVNATGLTPNTYYYIRSYATNNQGTGYGNELTERTPVTEILTPKIKVTYPNGGELYQAGQKVGVKWNSNIIVNSNDKVSIYLKEYSNNGGYEKPYTICSNCENSGLADVYIPSLDSRLKKYKVSIRLTTNDGFVTEDESDNLFTVNSSNTTPSITVLSPNGGEVYKVGDKITLKWKTENVPIDKNIRVYLDYESPWSRSQGLELDSGSQSILYKTLNDGIETWDINASLMEQLKVNSVDKSQFFGKAYKIRMYYDFYDGTFVKDSSDNSFTITSSAPIPVTVPPCAPYGDVDYDGYLTEKDTTLIMQKIAAVISFSAEQIKRADVNKDGNVSGLDVTLIKNYMSGSSTTFPVCNSTCSLSAKNGMAETYLSADKKSWGFRIDLNATNKPTNSNGWITNFQGYTPKVNIYGVSQTFGNFFISDTQSLIFTATDQIDTNCKYTTTITPPSTTTFPITITSPNGGELYTPGQQITLKWNSRSNKLENVAFNLNSVQSPNNGIGLNDKNGKFLFPNTGEANIILPTSAVMDSLKFNYGNYFKIVMMTSDLSVTPHKYYTDSSDNTFTILTTANFCKDSDDGKKIDGDVIGWTSVLINGVSKDYKDYSIGKNGGYCSGTSCTGIVEYYCEGNIIKSASRQCSSGYSINGGCFNSPATPSITVTSPNGGETFKAGDSIKIEYKGQNIPNDSIVSAYLESSTSSSRHLTLADHVTDVPLLVNLPKDVSGNFKVRVIVRDRAALVAPIIDLSDNYFTLTPSDSYVQSNSKYCSTYSLHLDLSRGSSGGEIESLQSILSTLDYIDDKDVDGKFGKGTRSAVIAFQSANGIYPDGIVGFETRMALKKQWQAKCIGNTITNSGGTPSITVLSPNDGREVFRVGDKMNIKWKTENISSSENVRISFIYNHTDEIYNSNGTIDDWITSEPIANTGYYSFNIPKFYSTGMKASSFKIKVSKDDFSDYSDSYFKIVQEDKSSDFKVSGPTKGSVYRNGDLINLSWDKNNDGSYMVSLLKKNDPSFSIFSLDLLYPSSDKYQWMVLNNLSEGEYYFKVNQGPMRSYVGYSDSFIIKN